MATIVSTLFSALDGVVEVDPTWHFPYFDEAMGAAVGEDSHRSAAQQMGNRLAYDRLLAQACDMLEIHHDLAGEAHGMERDIERFRVEAELERAGVRVTDRRFGQAA